VPDLIASGFAVQAANTPTSKSAIPVKRTALILHLCKNAERQAS